MINAKKITANILSLVILSYLGTLIINNEINRTNALIIAKLEPSIPKTLKLKRLYTPSDILETGSLIIQESPNIPATAIKTSWKFVKGFNFGSLSLVFDISSSETTGLVPISPKISCANQNCNKPNSIKIPAKPKPHLQPTCSPMYPQSRIPKNAPAFTPI